MVFWGTFFPLISEAVTGTKASVGPPWFDRYTVPLALVLVLLSGIGPVIAWRRATLANARRNFLLPAGAALVALVALVASRRRPSSPLALVDVRGRAPSRSPRSARSSGAGTRARRAMTGEAAPVALGVARAPQPPPLRRLHRAPRDRGAVRRRRGVLGLPARARRAALAGADRADRRLRRPLRPGHRAASTGEKITLGADPPGLQARPPRRDPAPEPRLLPVRRAVRVRSGRALLRGRGDERGRPEGGSARTSGPRCSPTSTASRRSSTRSTARLKNAPPAQQARAAIGLAAVYAAQPPPATFRLIVSPLVTWIWLGGLIVIAGALHRAVAAALDGPRSA